MKKMCYYLKTFERNVCLSCRPWVVDAINFCQYGDIDDDEVCEPLSRLQETFDRLDTQIKKEESALDKLKDYRSALNGKTYYEDMNWQLQFSNLLGKVDEFLKAAKGE